MPTQRQLAPDLLKPKRKSRDAIALEAILEAAGFTGWEPEHYFARPRRLWRFDYAWPKLKIALEIEGGIWRGHSGRPCRVCGQPPRRPGRHNSPMGFLGDLEKYNCAALLGWIVVRLTDREIRTGAALVYVERAFRLREIYPAI